MTRTSRIKQRDHSIVFIDNHVSLNTLSMNSHTLLSCLSTKETDNKYGLQKLFWHNIGMLSKTPENVG